MLTRREDWPERLLEAIAHHSVLPFVWGKSDCIVFPADCIHAVTGEDPLRDVPPYDSALGAARALAERGFANAADAFASVLPEIPPAQAHRADVGVVDGAKGPCGVVFIGAEVLGVSAGIGHVRLPRSLVTRAFKVG
jgi:hypothetical protein